jgi:Coenzyme PQQ synthesis protein D (PqqD)
MTSATTLSSRPCRKAGIQRRTADGGTVLVDPAAKVEHVLNDTALALWELCDGDTTVEEMVVAAIGLFDAQGGRLEQDVLRALDAMTDQGLLERSVRR